MRVCVDALPLLVRSAGVKNYLYHWITHLQRAAEPGSIRLFPPLGDLAALDHERSLASPLRTGFGLASLALINYTGLPLHGWLSGGAGLFHSTNLIRRPPSRARLTTTLHDVTSWLMPELHSSANRRVDRGFEGLLRSACRVIAVSESTRQDAIRLLRINPGKIVTIHSGVAEPFFRAGPREADEARAACGLERPYALFLGTIEPRKNLGALLDAWQSLPGSLREEFDLAIAGPDGWADAALRARLASSPPGVRRLGYVPERLLPGLTAGATLFVYPSLYEGFGFPVAQAMAAGAPVVTSAVSSLPEITAGAAVLIDPRSPSEVRNALARLLLSPAERAARADAGRARASRFTWEECARRSLDFFRQALA